MEKEKNDKGVIFIGNKKPFMNYVTAVLMEIDKNPGKEIKVAARGMSILRAIDVVRVVQDKDKRIVDSKPMQRGSEKLDRKDNSGKDVKRDVAIIEIFLIKHKL